MNTLRHVLLRTATAGAVLLALSPVGTQTPDGIQLVQMMHGDKGMQGQGMQGQGAPGTHGQDTQNQTGQASPAPGMQGQAGQGQHPSDRVREGTRVAQRQ
ncbi:hypothetical protein SAMN02990966_05441 [Rhodospirillales bacterium URHD0017]|nr:hypothetical protein SAMN02990966_05441 [Rhodospirillales bacterium URHD0017]